MHLMVCLSLNRTVNNFVPKERTGKTKINNDVGRELLSYFLLDDWFSSKQ